MLLEDILVGGAAPYDQKKAGSKGRWCSYAAFLSVRHRLLTRGTYERG
jgi:hypothetical protein